MAAPIVQIDPRYPQPRLVERAVAALEAGGVIAYPTDTYYAIGCDLLNRKAVEKLYLLKQRPKSKPLTFLCADLSDASRYARISNFAYRTMKRLVPGPFTFILPATPLTPEIAMTRQKTVGIRISDAAIPRALVERLGHPLLTASATFEGEPLNDPKAIKERLGHGLELIIDGGDQVFEPSTVVSLLDDEIEILRQGKGKIEF
ncbi:MAG: L-threonylcarbamoyladenylate synthase [Pseudomonadota bacterium]|nr:MAG: threonylcarbamoyl-AMP synthase [Pseudomonadota bacterium]